MPFVALGAGRGYDILPVENVDPAVLLGTGKLYTKLVTGIAQLFFLSDDGTVYQLTPAGGAVPYPFQLPEEAGDPVPIPDTGQLYTKDDAGISQLYYEADNGAVYQLTPVVQPKNYVLVYDDGAVQTGNVYNNMQSLLAYGSTLPGPKTIQINIPSAPLPVFAYDFSEYELVYGGQSLGSTNLFFQGGATIVLPYRLENVGLFFDDSVTNTSLAFVVINSEARSMICDGECQIQFQATALSGKCVELVDSVFTLYLNGKSSLLNTPPVNAASRFFDGTNSSLNIVCADGAAFYGHGPSFVGGTIGVNFLGNGSFINPSLLTGTSGDKTYYRGAQNEPAAAYLYQTPTILGANQNDYNPAGLIWNDTLRISASLAVSISGFNAISGLNSNIQYYGLQTRKLINVGTQIISLLHNNAGSSAGNRILTNNGLTLAIGAGNWCFLWYDPISLAWRAKL